jgi:hypothetical protein
MSANLLDGLDIFVNIFWLGYRQCSFAALAKEVNHLGLALLTRCARRPETSEKKIGMGRDRSESKR